MFRRIACGAVLAAGLALTACSDTKTGIPPTPQPITETFTGTINPAGGATHSFTTLTGGSIKAVLTAVGPDSTKNVGFSLGTFNGTANTCSAVFDNPAATQAFEFNATASTIGAYCIRLYDNGGITTDGVPYTYTVTVTHPQ
jgi:hypothetical protein